MGMVIGIMNTDWDDEQRYGLGLLCLYIDLSIYLLNIGETEWITQLKEKERNKVGLLIVSEETQKIMKKL